MSSLTGMLPLVLMFVVLYFVMIRPQMKRQKEHRAMIDAIAKGDEVATAGGIVGKVTRLSEGFLHHEIAGAGAAHGLRQVIQEHPPVALRAPARPGAGSGGAGA